MHFGVTINISSKKYVVASNDLNYSKSYPPVCMTTKIDNNEIFLTIGEPIENYADDPEFLRMKGYKEIKVFNPFSSSKFEPLNASMVIRFFLKGLTEKIRHKLPAFFHDFFFLFWDKCTLALTIQNYEKLPLELRKEFEKEVKDIPTIKVLKIQ